MIKILILCLFTLNVFSSWKFAHKEDGVTIFAGKSQKSGVIPFKAIGIIDADVSNVSMVLKDHTKKHLWSPKLKNVKVHKKLSEADYIFSEYYKTPWPSTDREFLLAGKIVNHKNGSIEYIGKSIDNSFKRDDHIQTDVKTLNVLLRPLTDGKTEITFVFNGDMKGWMPVWLMNLIQKKWPLRFIQGLRKQVKYSSVLVSKN